MSDPQSPPPAGSSGPIEAYNISSEGRARLPDQFTDAELKQMLSDVPRPVSEVQAEAARLKARRGSFWVLLACNLVVFVSSVCIMVVELCASRLIASYLGSSLYTWTSVIGVVLAGISIGNYLGGKLADRVEPRRALGWQFLVAGLATLAILVLNPIASQLSRSQPSNLPWQYWVMVLVGVVFLLPAITLGTISPVTASLALRHSQKTGATVGNIYAWGAMGSIVGTFLAGFWLIGNLGTHHILWITASVLLVMGALMAGGQRGLRMLLLAGGLQLAVWLGLLSSLTGNQAEAVTRSLFAQVGPLRGVPQQLDRATTELAELTLVRDDSKRELDALQLAELAGEEVAPKVAEATERVTSLNQEMERFVQRLLPLRERQRKLDRWGVWANGLGRKLHDVGLQLGLRNDQLSEYYDESDYYTISIYPIEHDGETVKILRLDYLIHSYYNPAHPTRLHYDYEQVYAALTERARETARQKWSVVFDPPPASPDFAASLGDKANYTPATGLLTCEGALTPAQVIDLLQGVSDPQLWQAVTQTWRDESLAWRAATQFTEGKLTIPLDPDPPARAALDELTGDVVYDPALGGLVCSQPFSIERAFEVLATGVHRPSVEKIRELYGLGRQISTLFIGGGGFIFPRWVEAEFPNQPRIDVAEIDPAVLQAVQAELGLPREFGPPSEGKTWVSPHLGDARKFVDDRVAGNLQLASENQPLVRYDVVYGDAFNDLSVPWHLTTREFSEKIRALLTPHEGMYLVNLIDVYPRVKFPSRKARAAGWPQTRLPGPAPEGVFPPATHEATWYPAEKFPQLQLQLVSRTRDELDAGTPPNYVLGYRGVMTASQRDELLALFAGRSEWQEAIKALAQLSNNEPTGRFLGRYLKTARELFPYVYVFTSTDNSTDPGDRRDTFIVACSLKRLNCDDLFRSGGYWHNVPFATSERDESQPATQTLVNCELGPMLDSGEMTALLELARGETLTDDFAPVDNLLAPVFASRNEVDD